MKFKNATYLPKMDKKGFRWLFKKCVFKFSDYGYMMTFKPIVSVKLKTNEMLVSLKELKSDFYLGSNKFAAYKRFKEIIFNNCLVFQSTK